MLLSSWIYSLKWCYFLLLLTTIHGWSSHGIVPASRTSVCMAPHCPAHTQSQHWDTTMLFVKTVVQKAGADSTQKELNHFPWPCCPSGPTEQRAGRPSAFLLLSHQYGNKCTKGVTVMSKTAGSYSPFAGRHVLRGIFPHFCHLFI